MSWWTKIRKPLGLLAAVTAAVASGGTATPALANVIGAGEAGLGAGGLLSGGALAGDASGIAGNLAAESMAANTLAPHGLLGGVSKLSEMLPGLGGGMNQKQLMMAQMAMNMAKPGEPPPPQLGQPPGQAGPLPPAPSLLSPTPPMGRGVAGAIEGSAADTPYPGESYADFLERKKRETRGILK